MPLVGKKRVLEAIDEYVDAKEKYLRGAVFSAAFNIQLRTPVDTGRARSNWFFTIDSPSTKTTDITSGNTITYGDIPESIFGSKMYLTNNLPYITRLEYDGWSEQAKAGWVRTEILKLRKTIRSL